MRRLRRVPRSRAGFTLVEVLLTLVIMGGIMVTITQVLTGVRKTRDEIHNIQERQLAGPAILQRIERDLRALFPFNRDSQLLLRIRDDVTSGLDADTIDFASTVDGLMPYRDKVSDPFLRADVNEVGYRLRERPGSDDFLEIYRREDFGIDELPLDGGRFALLHDRVKGFNIEVFDEDGPEAEPVEAWENDEYVGIPTRIDIELTIEMAPRLVREQLVIDRRTITYRRSFRFPEILRRAVSLQPLPSIPRITPPSEEDLLPPGGAGPDPDAPDGGPGGGQGGPEGGQPTGSGFGDLEEGSTGGSFFGDEER